jgi:hypothetical protein
MKIKPIGILDGIAIGREDLEGNATSNLNTACSLNGYERTEFLAVPQDVCVSGCAGAKLNTLCETSVSGIMRCFTSRNIIS